MINLKINDKPLTVDEGTTILQAARKFKIDIPSLCYTPLHLVSAHNMLASCRVCVVEVKGRRNLAPACTTMCTEGMEVYTSTQRVINARRAVLELLLSDHPNDCPTCPKNKKCKLQDLAERMGIRQIRYAGERSRLNEYSDREYPIRLNPAKCILCSTCVKICNEVQTCGVLHETKRGFHTEVSAEFGLNLDLTNCVSCGQCINVCPTGALSQSSEVGRVWQALANPKKHVVCQVAPSVRAALGEEFGYNIGTSVTGKIPTAARIIGFEKCYDTNFGADLTIVEEATELIKRLTKGEGKLPMITSCCPGWINFIEKNYPDMLDLPSTCKSPMSMQGSMIKNYLAEKMGWNPEDVVVVSIMPCTAKKSEIKRQQLSHCGYSDDDYVLTTRDFAQMIRETGVSFDTLENSRFDEPMGESTGGADIFGNSGGVMEAALRTAKYWLEGKVDEAEIPGLRVMSGIKTGVVEIAGHKIRLCAVSGLGNARKILEEIRAGENKYDFIEVMACPGGCVNGGGQPFETSKQSVTIVKARSAALYNEDRGKIKRISAQNESIKALYDDFLGEYGGEKAEQYLHTHFTDQSLEKNKFDI